MDAIYETTIWGSTLDEITRAAMTRGFAFFGSTPFVITSVVVETEDVRMDGDARPASARVTMAKSNRL